MDRRSEAGAGTGDQRSHQQIRETKRASSAAATLEDKLVHQRALKALQTARNQKRKDLFVAQDEVESRRDALIADIETRMTKDQKIEPLFAIRWRLTYERDLARRRVTNFVKHLHTSLCAK